MDDLPYLDVTAPGFSTRSPEVLAAREMSWCARTPFGLAVLRHRHSGMILRDRRFRQGSHAWPDAVGLSGSFADFWRRSLIGQEGAAHQVLRRIAQAALSNDFVLSLCDAFEAEAEALLVACDRAERLEFMSAFSEPFSGRAVALLFGLPPDDAAQLAADARTLGLAMGLDAPAHAKEINASHDRLAVLARELIARADPMAYGGRLVAEAALAGIDDLAALVDLVVISIFGGVDTTRAQLGIALDHIAGTSHPVQWAHLRCDEPDAIPTCESKRRSGRWPDDHMVDAGGRRGLWTLDGVQPSAKGQTVHILAHATGTDPAAIAVAMAGSMCAPRRKIAFWLWRRRASLLGPVRCPHRHGLCDCGCLLQAIGLLFAFGQETPKLSARQSGNTSQLRLPLRVEWRT